MNGLGGPQGGRRSPGSVAEIGQGEGDLGGPGLRNDEFQGVFLGVGETT